MNYTYYRRRLLNSELKRKFPVIPWQENAQGNPRMRTCILPEGCKKILNADCLEEAFNYFSNRQQPMPLFVFMPAICKESQDEYDVNYVDVRIADSMEAASRLVGQGRVWVKNEE